MIVHWQRGFVAALCFLLAGCTTTPAEFQKNPKMVSKAALCRSLVESSDPLFQQQLVGELLRRRIDPGICPAMVQRQQQAAAAVVALALVGTAVAVCANNNCGGGYAAPRPYPGNCYSPNDRAADGRRCGARSAVSRPGGF